MHQHTRNLDPLDESHPLVQQPIQVEAQSEPNSSRGMTTRVVPAINPEAGRECANTDTDSHPCR